jgi:predicted short-subunit dehydrogenase-like oxidoreductase (DUF2520 family)
VSPARAVRVIGPGRAGRSLARALGATDGWHVREVLGRADDLRAAATGVDLLVIATPDDVIAAVAATVEPHAATVVAHLAGSRGLDVLAPHPRRAALHPLMTLPDEHRGAAALRGAWFATAGDPLVHDVVAALDGRSFAVTDDHRGVYHAAACVAANHVVALLGQVERLATAADVPFAAFFDIVRAAVDNTERLGPRAALTGPAARGDFDTLARHLAAMDPSERPAYKAMMLEARRLVA